LARTGRRPVLVDHRAPGGDDESPQQRVGYGAPRPRWAGERSVRAIEGVYPTAITAVQIVEVLHDPRIKFSEAELP